MTTAEQVFIDEESKPEPSVRELQKELYETKQKLIYYQNQAEMWKNFSTLSSKETDDLFEAWYDIRIQTNAGDLMKVMQTMVNTIWKASKIADRKKALVDGNLSPQFPPSPPPSQPSGKRPGKYEPV